VIEKAFDQAGFMNVRSERIDSPLELSSAAECVRFEKESFGALHQMMSSLSDEEKRSVWEEIEEELKKFETTDGFRGPCEMVVAVGQKP
jgi:hypothetical protein